MLLTLSILLMMPSLQSGIPTELQAYVSRRDDSFSWRAAVQKEGHHELQITSQTWQGVQWKHYISILWPESVLHRETAMLVITGDRTDADLEEARQLAAKASMPVATLYNVPNQPIWDLREDALIAHTFSKFLETGKTDWPLVFPMTKAAVRAMDAVQKHRPEIKRFVVTGLSKRGWTTWLVGATGDKRLAGIAPGIFDFLNIPAQLEGQLEAWGKYSEMLNDYSERGLQEKASSPEGKRLSAMVDPFSYRAKIKTPTLIIKGTNDPYWTVDATKHYWSELKQPKWMLTMPNVGHAVGTPYFETLGAFARAMAGEFKMPRVDVTVAFDRSTDPIGGDPTPIHMRLDAVPAGFVAAQAWYARAVAEHQEFQPSVWQVAGRFESARAAITLKVPPHVPVAVFVEATYKFGKTTLVVSTPIRMEQPH